MNKLFKGLGALALSLALILGFSSKTFAAENPYPYEPYYIESYDVAAFLTQSNVISVTERLTVNYNEPRQGIYRIIPVKNIVNKPVNGVNQELKYNVKISDISVDSAFDYYTEDGYLYIKIGEKGQYQTGPVDYTITYTMDLGDDRISEYDDVFFSVIGSDWDCPIDNITFSLTYPKSIDPDNIQVYSGRYGSLYNDKVKYLYDEGTKTLAGYSTQTLFPYEAVTLYTMLPEGYFVGERTVDTRSAYIFLALSLAFFALLVLHSRRTAASRQIVPVVNFYPPQDFTSAQVGYIIDGMTSDEEVLSLIIWLASKGYVFIKEQNDEEMIITKNEEKTGEDLPAHVKPLYDGLFTDDVKMVSSKELKLYSTVEQVKQLVPMEFSGEKKFSNGASTAVGVLFGLASIIFAGLGVGFSGGGVEDLCAFIGIFVVVISLIVMFYAQIKSANWEFMSPTRRNVGVILSVVAMGLLAGITYLFINKISFIGGLLPAVAVFFAVGSAYLSSHCKSYTTYYSRTVGDLLGLKEFIKQAELDRIKALVDENPQYFFDVLPYAYVFGLTDQWIKSFETIDVAPQSQYFGAYNGFGYYRMHWLYHSLGNVSGSLTPPPMTSGTGGTFNSSGFGGSGSGGGFSGGGFGGGGGRSW